MPEQDTSWWFGGFPALPMATDKQKFFLCGHWQQLCALIEETELCAIELMGQKAWLDDLTKKRATEMISTIKFGGKTLLEKAESEGHKDLDHTICRRCGSVMDESSVYHLSCAACGNMSFIVRTGE